MSKVRLAIFSETQIPKEWTKFTIRAHSAENEIKTRIPSMQKSANHKQSEKIVPTMFASHH